MRPSLFSTKFSVAYKITGFQTNRFRQTGFSEKPVFWKTGFLEKGLFHKSGLKIISVKIPVGWWRFHRKRRKIEGDPLTNVWDRTLPEVQARDGQGDFEKSSKYSKSINQSWQGRLFPEFWVKEWVTNVEKWQSSMKNPWLARQWTIWGPPFLPLWVTEVKRKVVLGHAQRGQKHVSTV